MGYFIFIGILILFYVSLHGKTYQENKFNGRGIVFYQNEFIGIFHIQIVEMVQLFIFSTIASYYIYLAYRQGLSNLTTYNITYLSRKELNSC